MLILFDIDGTLLHSRQAGRLAMLEAARELLGPATTLDGIEIAGRLDPLIWCDVARRHGVDDPMSLHERFRAVYAARLDALLARRPTVQALPGVQALVEALGREEGMTLGLLTGNYPETGRLKVRLAGLDVEQFTANAWGCDGGHRRDLPPVAMAQYAAQNGGPIDPAAVLVIGDTPHDVDCARHNGCRSLAVATGLFSMEALTECNADLVTSDLSQTEALVRWIRE